MRIAMLHPALTWRGGAERQILTLALKLQQAEHTVEIFTCAQNNKCFPELANQLTITVVKAPGTQPVPNLTQKRTFFTRLAGRFRGYATDLPSMIYLASKIPKGFDLINCHNAPTEWAAFFAKNKLNAPIVWNCNEPPFWYSDPYQRRGLGKLNLPLYRGLDRIAVGYIDLIVSNSLVGNRRIEAAYGRQAVTVRPGIAMEQFRKASEKQARSKYGLENSFVLLQVGNIARDKRQSDSIIALSYLAKKHDDVKLVLVGQGPREELVELSKKLCVNQKMLYLQNCSDQEIADLYAACNVFVFPAEITWGLAVLEAMASSKPVLVSPKAGVSEVIKNYQNGILIREPYAKNMADEIEKLIAKDTLRHKIGLNAYEYIKENLTWDAYAKNMETVFQKTIQNYRGC